MGINKTIINLTPHTVNVLDIDEYVISYEPAGQVTRLKQNQVMVDMINDHDVVINNITDVIDLPEPENDTYYIVSFMVREHCFNRFDLLSPDTGFTAIRDSKGHIQAVRGFIINKKG